MWRKSSCSGSTEGGQCVEIAFAQRVGVRDSKNPEPRLTFPEVSFRVFVGQVGPRGSSAR